MSILTDMSRLIIPLRFKLFVFVYILFYVFSSFVEPDVPEGWGKDVSMVRDAEVATLRTPHSMFFTFNGAKVR